MHLALRERSALRIDLRSGGSYNHRRLWVEANGGGYGS